MTTDTVIITSPVLIPYTPDCEYEYGEEVLPPEKIQHLANTFEKYQIIDLQHEFTKRLINHLEPIPRGKLLKSYISKEKLLLKGLDGITREYPSGTWIIMVEITDPEAMKLYNSGALTGLSITVKEKEHADTIIKYLSEHSIPYLPDHIIDAEKGFYKKPKRILMKDVENPVAFTVSLVKQPCVYGAKFCKNSCLIVNENKLKENKILNIKEKIKKEINNFIDGLDVEESIKEDVTETEATKETTEAEVEAEKEETEVTTEAEKEETVETEAEAEKADAKKCSKSGTKTIYGRKVKVPEATKEAEPEPESVKEEGDDDGEEESLTPPTGSVGAGEGEDSGDGADLDGEGEETTTPADNGEDKDGDKGTGKGKVKKEAKKEDIAETESDKEVLYLAQDDVENLISTTLRRYAEEIEQMVFDGIQEALDDYLFANEYSYKEDKEAEKAEPETEEEQPEPEIEEEESQKNYATPEMVQSMFDEQFASFKSTIMDGIKQAQKESIKSYSKAINPSDDGLKQETTKETFKPKVERDFNGCRIRKR